jgi:hypothetical protein
MGSLLIHLCIANVLVLPLVLPLCFAREIFSLRPLGHGFLCHWVCVECLFLRSPSRAPYRSRFLMTYRHYESEGVLSNTNTERKYKGVGTSTRDVGR